MTKKTEEVIELKKIEIAYLPLMLVGDSPLIVHAWGNKAKQEMLDKQMKKAKAVKEAKNPIADVINSLYWLEGKPEEMTEEAFVGAIKKGAKFGFRSTAFKEAAVSAGYRAGVIKNKVSAYAAFHIDGELVEIIGTPEPREDMVRLAGPRKSPLFELMRTLKMMTAKKVGYTCLLKWLCPILKCRNKLSVT
jgi:hypothetical protein